MSALISRIVIDEMDTQDKASHQQIASVTIASIKFKGPEHILRKNVFAAFFGSLGQKSQSSVQ